MSRMIGRAAAVAAFIVAQATVAGAAEVKVFSTIGVQAALEELTPKFEKASGHKLNITWATAAVLVKRVQGGETADLLVLTIVLDSLSESQRTEGFYREFWR
jgi:molybdate transport system substrate-binding protein